MKTKSQEVALNELINALSLTRKDLPYDDHDPVRNRKAGIEQMEAVKAFLRSQGIDYPLISPFCEFLDALKGLDNRRDSLLFKPKDAAKNKHRHDHALAAAALDFLSASAGMEKTKAAGEILKLMKKYHIPPLPERSTNSSSDENKSREDQRSPKKQLIEWAKACRNGAKGEEIKEYYSRTLSFFQDHLATDSTLAPIQIIENHLELLFIPHKSTEKVFTLFGEDCDPYRV